MQYDPQKITFFAETDARGRRTKFGIKAEDRTRHVYVIGKTGMGKSTLLENMAVQDIKNGEGMAFIDPHGSTAEKLLDYIPEERIKDVLYFAPFDMETPVSFNVMEDVGQDKRHLVVSGLMSTFKKIWVDAWSARMEYILSNTLLALLEYPGSTLLGVNRMLSDKTYREAVVANVKDPSVRSFWVDEFAKYNERYMQEAGDAIKNKIGQFTANPLIRNIIGQPTSSFDVRQFMDERKILIVNLSKGLIGETNANLLGSMLITKIYLAAMSRADLPAATMKQMPNFYFYVDEFQSFANEAFANILSEARKYKLNLTIAHQYIEQMEETVRNAVFGNVGTIIAFRVGPFDAEVLETIFSPEFMATDIVNLGFAQVYLTLMIDGIGSRPFSAVTLPPIDLSKVSYRDVVLGTSRKSFAKPRLEIEEAIRKWHEPLPKPPKPESVRTDTRPDQKQSPAASTTHTERKPYVPAARDTSSYSAAPRSDTRPDVPKETRHETRSETRPENQPETRHEERRDERTQANSSTPAHTSHTSHDARPPAPQVVLQSASPVTNEPERKESAAEYKPHAEREHRTSKHERPRTHGTATAGAPVRTHAYPNNVSEAPRPHKSVDDLRAVLAGIAKPKQSEVKQSRPPERVPTPPNGNPDLRSALAAVLKAAERPSSVESPAPEVTRGGSETSSPEEAKLTPPSEAFLKSDVQHAPMPPRTENIEKTEPPQSSVPPEKRREVPDDEREVLARLEKILKGKSHERPPLRGR